MHARHLFVAAGLAVLFASCGDSATGHTTYALFRNLSLSPAVEVLFPRELDDTSLRAVVERLRARDSIEAILRPGQSVDRAGDLPRIVIADSRTAGIETLLEALEVEVAPNGSFAFLDRTYEGLDDALVATFADPARDGLPITLYFGVDAARVASFVRDLRPTWRPAFRCWRAGVIEREGHWDEEGDAVGSAASADLDALPRTPLETLSGPGFDLALHGEFPPAALTNYRERLRSVRAATFALFGVDPADEARAHLTAHVWPSAHHLAVATGTWAWSTVGPAPGQIHVVLEPHHDDGFAAAQSWAVALAGAPAGGWMLDGLSVHLANSWWGKHLFSEWLPFLASRGLMPTVQALVDPYARLSPHVLVPSRGALFAFALERDRDALLDAWHGRGELVLPSDEELAAWIERASAGGVSNWSTPRFDAARDSVFRRGVHLLPPRDDDRRGFRGLGTLACGRSLRAAFDVGANAFALSPIAYLDGGLPRWAGEIDDGPFATSTPDVALAQTCAQAPGMHALIAPQLLSSRSGTWAGWIMATTDEQWSRFFAELERCLEHYALLAELCNADVLCLGSGLGASTRSQVAAVDEAYTADWLRHNTERWERVIVHTRRAFRGALTYAAAQHGEAKQVGFWPALDFVGVDAYRSLASDPEHPVRPDDAQVIAKLRGVFQQTSELARAAGKLALVTELGFPPTSEAWLAPELANGELDLEEQRRLFACAAEALKRQMNSSTPLAGLYVFGWSTDPNAGRVADRTFTPQNRPAARSLATMFGRP